MDIQTQSYYAMAGFEHRRIHISSILKHADVVPDPLFLVLRNTLGYPCDITDLLI